MSRYVLQRISVPLLLTGLLPSSATTVAGITGMSSMGLDSRPFHMLWQLPCQEKCLGPIKKRYVNRYRIVRSSRGESFRKVPCRTQAPRRTSTRSVCAAPGPLRPHSFRKDTCPQALARCTSENLPVEFFAKAPGRPPLARRFRPPPTPRRAARAGRAPAPAAPQRSSARCARPPQALAALRWAPAAGAGGA